MSFPSPSVEAPTLEDFQFQYGGITFGGFAENSNYHFIDSDGLYNLATTQSGDQQRPMDQGEYAGVDVFGGRDITTSMVVRSTLAQSFDDARQALSKVMKVKGSFPAPLWVQLPSGLFVSECRPRKFDAPMDFIAVQAHAVTAHMLWHSTDPRLYRSPSKLVSREGNGSLVVDNKGNEECRPIWIVEAGPGGTEKIRLTNTTLAGEPYVEFAFPLSAGSTLVVDFDFGTAVRNGFEVRTYTKTSASTWWSLEPGEATLAFSSTSGEARCRVEYADAFVAA